MKRILIMISNDNSVYMQGGPDIVQVAPLHRVLDFEGSQNFFTSYYIY